jgi:hypothetical protein
VAVAVEHARQEWEEEHRRLESLAGDQRLYRHLLAQLEAMTTELRRRVGQTFTLAELAEAYTQADVWGYEALSRSSRAIDLAHATTVEGAAFHLYSRGAVDYSP